MARHGAGFDNTCQMTWSNPKHIFFCRIWLCLGTRQTISKWAEFFLLKISFSYSSKIGKWSFTNMCHTFLMYVSKHCTTLHHHPQKYFISEPEWHGLGHWTKSFIFSKLWPIPNLQTSLRREKGCNCALRCKLASVKKEKKPFIPIVEEPSSSWRRGRDGV